MPKCNKCGKEFAYGNRADGLPNGVGLELENKKKIYICSDCILELGELTDEEKERFIDDIVAEYKGDKEMTDNKFITLCKNEVKKYAEEHLDKSDSKVDFDVYIVWYCKTLQNWKALASTTLADGMYYELTLNGDKQELYLDAYKKFENKCIKLESEG